MFIFRKLLLILLISLSEVISESNDNSHCVASKKLDEQCGKYCYNIVKPLLQYASSVRSKEDKFTELNNKISSLEATIKLQETELQLRKSHENYCLIKEDLVDQIKDLISVNNNIQHECKTKLKNKDAEITNLKDQEIAKSNKIRELENRLTRQHLPSSCKGKETGIYEIQIPGSNPFNVFCDSGLVGCGWTVILRRHNNSVNFDQTMQEYRSGFGTLNGSFFLGLDKLHLLTKSRKHEIYIYMKKFNNEVRYARYNHFLIGGAEECFKLKALGNYTGTAGDAMASSLNMKFSTYDHNTFLCLYDFSTPGWCDHSANYVREYCIRWKTLTSEPLKFVQMMIKSVE